MRITLNNKFIINTFVYFIFGLAFLERTVFDLGPNVELVTLSILLASVYLTPKTTLRLTFLLMAATDMVLGNTRIFIFTWTGFLIPVLIISRFSNLLKTDPSGRRVVNCKLKILGPLVAGIFSNLFFYLWTNFGVWFLDSWGMYSRDLSGLLHTYYMGLPFLRLQLAGTLLFVPLGFLLVQKIGRWCIILDTSGISSFFDATIKS